MGIPYHVTCLLRNLYSGQEATVNIGCGITDWFQISKGVYHGYIVSPCLFNLYAEYILWNSRLDEAQARLKIAEEKSITSDMQMTLPLWPQSKEDLKSLLVILKEDSENVDFKLNIQKTKITASFPIISWQIDGETMTVTDYFSGLQNHCRWWPQLSPWRKAMSNLDRILKSRDITWPTTVHLANVMIFSVACMDVSCTKESWALENWCLWTVGLEKTLESPLGLQGDPTSPSKGDQSWVFIGRTDAEAETP